MASDYNCLMYVIQWKPGPPPTRCYGDFSLACAKTKLVVSRPYFGGVFEVK